MPTEGDQATPIVSTMSIFNPPNAHSFQPLSSYQQLSGVNTGSLGLPTYEVILESLRTLMRASKQPGLSKHELKMRMERSFIDFRREFEVMCLERGLYD